MRRVSVLNSKQLSPYAQALKHVALKGKVAVGPTVAEEELMMYRDGTLPADYRPPVQGAWDDTIERWAYAWQYPMDEDTGGSLAQKVSTAPEMRYVTDFANRLLEAPLSQVPGSAKAAAKSLEGNKSEALDAPSSADSGFISAEEEAALLRLLEGEGAPGPSSGAEAGSSETEDVEKKKASRVVETTNFSDPAELEALASVEEGLEEALADTGRESAAPDYTKMLTSAEYGSKINVPAAYIDDGSELAAASKELGNILIEKLGIRYDPNGVTTAISALAINGDAMAARALMEFAFHVGFPKSASAYNALMLASVNNVEDAISIVEEMKDEGITPTHHTWHSLMRSLIASNDCSGALQVVDNMKSFANLEPNETTFYMQLTALARDRSRESSLYEAIQLFDQMEHVYGFIPSRRHYHTMLGAFAGSTDPEMHQRARDMAQKMMMLGLVWNDVTIDLLLRCAAKTGDIRWCNDLFAKMRNDKIQTNIKHLARAVRCHSVALEAHVADYDALAVKGVTPLEHWLEHVGIGFGMFDLVVERGWKVTTLFVDQLLHLICNATMVAVDLSPSDTDTIGRLEEQAVKLWKTTYDEMRCEKSLFSYETYIGFLAHLQRIDEAEALFQEVVVQRDDTPTRKTYESLVYMHVKSGEEGGTARALQYLDAMERANINVRASSLRKFVKLSDEAGYKRDMKRRARRIIQAREEFMARKAEGVEMEVKPYEAPTHDEEGNVIPVPLPVDPSSSLAWWDKWKRETVSKHELFETEADDGTPRGEVFEEKNEALAKMGIQSQFLTKESLPSTKRDLLPKANEEMGHGALWALDGGELSYPSDGNGPDGWGVALWRQRQALLKEYKKVQDGVEAAPELSALGNAHRLVPDQLAVEQSGAKTAGDLADAKKFTDHVYDDGTAKPPSEMAAPVPIGAEMVWQQQKTDGLAPYKTDDELSMDAESTFFADLEAETDRKFDATIDVLKKGNLADDSEQVQMRGVTKRSKHDFLSRFRQMHSQGTLEVPDAPVLRFGSTPTDHEETMAATIRGWYRRQQSAPPTEAHVQQWKKDAKRGHEAMSSIRSTAKNRKKDARRRAERHNKSVDQQQSF